MLLGLLCLSPDVHCLYVVASGVFYLRSSFSAVGRVGCFLKRLAAPAGWLASFAVARCGSGMRLDEVPRVERLLCHRLFEVLFCFSDGPDTRGLSVRRWSVPAFLDGLCA